jgi:hypothetical protein
MSGRQFTIEIGHAFAKQIARLVYRNGFMHDPEAKLLVLQPRAEIEGLGVAEILQRLVEKTDVRSLGYLAKQADSRLPQSRIGRRLLPGQGNRPPGYLGFGDRLSEVAGASH